MAVFVIDEIMGRGKTTAMMRFVNAASRQKKFLFITPYLTEVTRIGEACKRRDFYEPETDESGGKLDHLKMALTQKQDIVSTHALFGMMDEEALDLVKAGGYTLIIDEAPCVFYMPTISQYDMDNIMSKYVKVEEDGRLVWTEGGYIGKYYMYRNEIEKGCTYKHGLKWISLMPLDLFTSFEDVYVMTYMFYDQLVRCYFDLHNIGYTRKYVVGDTYETFQLSDKPGRQKPLDFRDKIHICDSSKMNEVGKKHSALSKNDYVNNMRSWNCYMARTLGNNTYNMFRHVAGGHGVPAEQTMWTTYTNDFYGEAEFKQFIMGVDDDGRRHRKISPTQFVSCNARGTNAYRNCIALAYLVNRYPNAAITTFLGVNNIHFDQKRYALSEMLQWIWRSAIRDDKEIWIYIPSRRMREMLENWIEEVSTKC